MLAEFCCDGFAPQFFFGDLHLTNMCLFLGRDCHLGTFDVICDLRSRSLENRGGFFSAVLLVDYTLPPTIMEVEHYPIVKESHLGGTHFPLL